ncbi:MAG: zinc ribbon domain-containing protein [Ruminococcaceae bacterium]|nr:zinc ribbon domain-containing protein [Oscillospiraceae bacterium]
MKFCEKCGKEIMDEAVVCPGCGCKTEMEVEVGIDVKNEEKVKKKVRGKKLFLIIGASAMALVLIACAVIGVLFSPRDLFFSDIERTGMVGAIIKYGCPSDISTDDETGAKVLRYPDNESLKLMGFTPYGFAVYPEEGKVVFFFSSDDGEQIYRSILAHCEFEKNILDCFHEFSYGNDLKITTNAYDGSYVSIEILD